MVHNTFVWLIKLSYDYLLRAAAPNMNIEVNARKLFVLIYLVETFTKLACSFACLIKNACYLQSLVYTIIVLVKCNLIKLERQVLCTLERNL